MTDTVPIAAPWAPARALAVACLAPVSLALLATAGAPAHAQDSGIPFAQSQGGLVQPSHTSPIQQFEAFRGAGLDAPRPPGRGVQPVAPFLPRLRQHRDSRPLPITPVIAFDRAPGDQPYRNDVIRLPGGELDALRRSARPIKPIGGTSSAGTVFEPHTQATLRTPEAYARAFGRFADAGDLFEDGNGNDVPFEYQRNTEQVILGWTPDPGFELFGVVLRDEIDDDATPSAGLDNVETDRLVGRVGFEARRGFGVFDRVRAEVRVRDASRTNNNFDVRDFGDAPGPLRIEVDLERRFIDGRVFGDLMTGPVQHRVGVDWVTEGRDALRFADSTPSADDPTLDILSARLFPDVAMAELGPTWEAAFSPSENDHLRMALGYRFVTADADDVDVLGEGPFATLGPGVVATPRNAYEFYYGETEIAQIDHLINGKLLYQREFAQDRLTLFGEFARIDRAADSKERYWSSLAPPPAAFNRLVGDPELDPERHMQAAGGFVFDGPDWIGFGRARRTGEAVSLGAWRLAAALRFSHVDDFITRDRARLQDGIFQDDLALVFRNVDVNMLTAEGDAQWNLTPNIAARANVVVTYAQNLTDDRPLYGIAPMEGNLLLEYHDRLKRIGNWSVGGKLRMVADQRRVDADEALGAGFDEGETDGFVALDLYAGVQLFDRGALRLGLENLFDQTYQEHVARGTVDFLQRQRITAPGRSVFLRGIASF